MPTFDGPPSRVRRDAMGWSRNGRRNPAPFSVWLCMPSPHFSSLPTNAWPITVAVVTRAVEQFSSVGQRVRIHGITAGAADQIVTASHRLVVPPATRHRCLRVGSWWPSAITRITSPGRRRTRAAAGTGRADLVIVASPEPLDSPLADTVARVAETVAAGATLTVLTPRRTTVRRPAPSLPLVIDTARSAGLTYRQHIVAVTRPPNPPTSRPCRESQPDGRVDVLVFTRPKALA